jgi:hypothetical protein
VLTLSLNGVLKLIDLRMEQSFKTFEDDSIMEQFLGLGHSKVEISEDGELAFILSPLGQLTAFNLNDGRVVGKLNKSEMIKDFCCYPNSSKIAAIDR